MPVSLLWNDSEKIMAATRAHRRPMTLPDISTWTTPTMR